MLYASLSVLAQQITCPLNKWTFFLSNYVMLLRKAFKLACNGSNLSKGRAGNSILFESCFLLSKQERGTSKKETRMTQREKNALRSIWSSFVSCTYPAHPFHILCIFWTLHQFNVACLYSCLSHFLFYKVNLILLQKYLHVTTVTVGIWMHEYLWIIKSF